MIIVSVNHVITLWTGKMHERRCRSFVRKWTGGITAKCHDNIYLGSPLDGLSICIENRKQGV